jgi:hypothetical protein
MGDSNLLHMFSRALLIIAVFAGLVGAQLESRGLCADNRAPMCGGCCDPKSEASCCRGSEAPSPPVLAPTANAAPDWKVATPSVVLILPALTAQDFPRVSFPSETPRANGLARIERTCVRLI